VISQSIKTLFDLYTFSIIEVELTEEVERKEEEKIKDEEIKILSNQALKDYNSGEFEKAIQIFKDILSIEPTQLIARMMIQKYY